MAKKRIGVFVCHCGMNIAGVVDVKRVVEAVLSHPNVVFAQDYIYMCSEPGQALVVQKIKEHNLDGLVMANCSPTLHEKTFRRLAQRAGMNPYMVEVANIREMVSWCNQEDKEVATRKAIRIVLTTVEKVLNNVSLIPIEVPVTKRALVIGGGVAGIQAALDIADSGYHVYLVEQSGSIGGKMVQLSETFPTLDCPQCILTPKMTDVAQHPNITLFAYSEVESVDGYVGNFTVRIRHKATYVDWDICNGCGLCIQKCPAKVPDEFTRGLSTRKAVFIPFPQAVPNTPRIDPDTCLYFKKGICRVCEKVCELNAIDFEQKDSFEEIEVGAIVVATGFELYDIKKIPEYGGGELPDVVDGLQFEQLLAPAGPTNGVPRRVSDGKIPKRVVFIQCVRSRDPEHGMAYCSRFCCMYTAKQAMLYKQAVPDGEAYVFYIDIRSNGKGYEEFIERAKDEGGVVYIRGKVARVVPTPDGKRLEVWGADTLSGREVKIDADMVVLATAAIPHEKGIDVATKLHLQMDEYGWLKEAHLKLRPEETVTAGMFIAGTAQFPKDITDTVAQASAAASKVIELFSHDVITPEPIIASVDEEVCSGCGYCEENCAYDAIKLHPRRKVAYVNEALCTGCGACTIACPSGAVQLRNFFRHQILDMVDTISKEY
ncbi:CoB--CoM heterodisulfide reductase iron-sulfur subunit A family protein [bacterium]|nr:CoB--CoM heterodisulfide reductase iron-sulfur subunit A family protein [bacterium]